ncbi:MAG: adenylate/guanylate cyclase domain-containing protein [Akkermansiaceae bacterium]
MPRLILFTTKKQVEFEVEDSNTIGRHPANTIQIRDGNVSKKHATILKNDQGQYILKDCGSMNGTFIGAKKITEEKLDDGTEFFLGFVRLVFVNGGEDDIAISRGVTIVENQIDSYIRERLPAPQASREFLPEKVVDSEEALREDYEKLRFAHEIARTISSELDEERLLERILDHVFITLSAGRGVILLLEDESGLLLPRASKQRDDSDKDIKLSSSIINEVAKEKAGVLSADALVDQRFNCAHSVIQEGIRSAMCVPLLHGDDLLGVMHVDSKVASNAFSEKDLQIFSTIAAQAAVSIANARMAKKIQENAKQRARYERLVSPVVVEQIVSGKLKVEQGGELRRTTILFADIRGFTKTTEEKPPQEIVNLLNDYYDMMVEVLFRCRGTLDKFIGDGLMAQFGAPIEIENPETCAVLCALEMQKKLRAFNKARSELKQPPVHIGIGIDTGEVVTGMIGSSRAFQYTAIGDTVNTASRLCDIAKPGQIIISQDTMDAIGAKIESDEIGRVRVKGKQDELMVFNVTGAHSSVWHEFIQSV